MLCCLSVSFGLNSVMSRTFCVQGGNFVIKIRGFLGLAEYYRRFVKDFSRIGWPMTLWMKNEKKIEWLDECEQAFRILKNT